MSISPVFDETYRHYLSLIKDIDYLAKAELLGVQREGSSLVVPLYDVTYQVSEEGIFDLDGNDVEPAVRVILGKYILMADSFEDAGEAPFRSYRDFRDSSPLISYFTTNTNKLLENTYSGKLELLRTRAKSIGGEELEVVGYDYSVLFHALPRIPVQLNFNDKDDMFAAACSVLYRATAENFLDMECLAMTGTLLAGKLVSQKTFI